MAKSLSLKLNFLIYPSEDAPGDYVAHCLEMDVVAVEHSRADAVALLKEFIEDLIHRANETDTLHKLLKPAPDKYWQQLFLARAWPAPPRIKKRTIRSKSVCAVNYQDASSLYAAAT